MAGNGINFLRKRRQRALRYQPLDKRILQLSIVVAVVAVVITIGLLFWTQNSVQELETIKQQQRSTQALVNKQASSEADYILYAARLNILQSILTGRGSQQRALEFLAELARADIAFDRISYDDEKKTLTFRVKAQNVLTVERFLNTLRSPNVRSKFVNLALNDIKRDENQIYSLEMSVQLETEEESNG